MAGFCVSGFRIQPSNPPTPTPTYSAVSTVVLGRFNGGNGSVTVPGGTDSDPFTGVSVGDVMVAFLNTFDNSGRGNPSPTTLAGYEPAGWTIVREDYNAATGSLHGPMYAGIMTHTVIPDDPLSYTFSRPVENPLEAAAINASIAIAHNSSGIESTRVNTILSYLGDEQNAPSVTTTYHVELVFLGTLFGTGSGSVLTSVNGLPDAKDRANSQSNDAFYEFSTGGSSVAQPFTCNHTQDAMTLYTVAMLPLL